MSVKEGRSNIADVYEKGLCSGCGVCAGICPIGAIKMEETKEGVYRPVVDGQRCVHCGLCRDVCPGIGVNFKKLDREIFGREPSDLLLGNYLKLYAGEAVDSGVRARGASGGVATAILLYALEKKLIDGALVTVMEGLRPKVVLARSAKEIMAAAKSKYCPVPVGVGIKDILKEKGKYAVVGLPCHIQGFRKAEKEDPRLRERAVLYLGIFCGLTPSFKGTDFLLKRMRILSGEVRSVAYRARGWPGGLEVVLKSGERRFLPLGKYWPPIFGRFFFTPYRCTLCSDNLAELADIAVGDAWLPEYSNESAGKSILLSRSRRGERLLQSVCKGGKIRLEEVSADKVIQAQKNSTFFKKRNITARRRLVTAFGKSFPDYGLRFMKSNLWDLIGAIMVYTNLWLSKQAVFCSVLKYVPHKVLMGYGFIMQKIFDRTYSRGDYEK
jgi:coenzyme F420 hydrogenase subunit beta